MRTVQTAVAIIFDAHEYLLMEKVNKIKRWQFVQGAVEKDETPEQAVKREVLEETGLSDVEIVAMLPENTEYWYVWEKEKVHKLCTFFLIKTKKTMNIKLSIEHDAFKWVSYEEALKMLKYNKQQLKEAEKLLK